MNEFQTYNVNTSFAASNSQFGSNDGVFNIDSHNSTNMKVKKPKVTSNDLQVPLPSKKLFSDSDATKRIQAINTDIYESATKEKEKHEFNFKRYFTIFGIITVLTAAIAYFRKR